MFKPTFSEFAYFDTNIILEIAKNRQSWTTLANFLEKNDLTLGLSTGQIPELADAKALIDELICLLLSVPSAFIKIWSDLIEEEIQAHPEKRNQSLLMKPINSMLLETDGVEKLRKFFFEDLTEVRNQQRESSIHLKPQLLKVKNNFPSTKEGIYSKDQANLFVDCIVLQWLSRDHRDFLTNFKDDISRLHLENFYSIRSFAYYIFYKYYIGKRDPDKLSDFGDLGHMTYLPYCRLIVTERDMCNILNQVKRNHQIFCSTEIRNIEFLVKWDY